MSAKLTHEEMASRLNGREYGFEITPEEEALAKDNGLVVIFGYSDDDIECCGVVCDELGCFGGGDFWISKNGIRPTSDGGPNYEAGEWLLKAVWYDPSVGASWSYKTDAPHSTFNIYEDGELYCVGIVLRL